jgi:hypothetical protein
MSRPARIARASLALFGALSLLLASHASAQTAVAPQTSASVYVRTDTDQTTVISPRLQARAPLTESTSAELVYAVDVWSSASIDIRTSASKAVTEQRDEINASVTQELRDMRLTGSYRFSTEPDYESHTAALGAERDFGDKSTVIGASASLGFDTVGQVNEPSFEEHLRSIGARASGLQLIDPYTFVQLEYEIGHARGYQASPYRFIGIGTSDATCQVDEPDQIIVYCPRETNPQLRVRHAAALRARRAILDWLSVGAEYRFYLDSWDVQSNTIGADVAVLPTERASLALRYRFYTQTAAEHYRTHYEEERDDGLYTRDKELSPLSSHKLALDAEQAFLMDGRGRTLRALLSIGPVFYSYSDHPLIDSITALDATLSLVLDL